MRFGSFRVFRRAVACALVAAFASLAFHDSAMAAPSLSLDMLTWHIVGLDSNNPLAQGPNEFLSGVRVCNTGPDPANNITASYVFDTANPYVAISPRGTSTLSAPFILSGDCLDFYFLLRVTRTPLAFNTTRRFHIEIAADNHATVSTPAPRDIFVEKLISQNRNDVLSVSGPSSVYVGQIVNYTVHSKTATQGYEQLSSFLDFPNLLFQIQSVDVDYSAPPGATNDRVYADACGWDDAPGPTPPAGTYRSCKGPAQYSGGKAGGLVDTVYSVKFLSSGSSSVQETIYDFSGSSFHYNADIGLNTINITTLEPLPTIQLNKHCEPSPAVPGAALTCVIEYGNNSESTTLTGVEINETYDPRTSYVSAVPAPDAGNNHWSIGTLAPGDYGIITVQLTVSASANDGDVLLNRVTIHDDVSAANDAPGDPPGVFKAVEFEIPVAEDLPGTALLRVTKTGLPDPEVGAGSNIVYTIHYRNDGQATSYSTVLTDTLGNGLGFVSALPAPATSSAPTYTWNLGNLAPGASGNITVTVNTNTGLSSATIVENDVVLAGNPGAGTSDTSGLVAYAEEVQFIRGGASAVADVSVTKSDSPDPIVQGGLLTYTIGVSNAGPDVAAGVVVTDVLDPDTTFISSSADCVEAPAGTLTCSLGDLALGASTSFTINVAVGNSAPTAGTLSAGPCNGSEDLCNNVTVDSDASDPVTGNNGDSEPTNVTIEADDCDLTVDKTDLTDPVAPGGTVTYEITTHNNGPDNASDVVIRDELDPNTTLVSVSGFPGGCSSISPTVYECHYNSMPSGSTKVGSITVSVNASAPSAGSLQSGPCDGSEDLCNRVVSVTATGCAETNLANNTADEPTNVTRPSSNLSITKTDVGFDPVVQGAPVTYTLNVANAGPALAEDVVVVDMLDSDTTYVSDTAPDGCVEAPAGTLTCQLGDLSVAASSTFTVTVLVSGSAPTAGTTMSGTCASAGVDICNSATVSSYSNDPTPGNNTAQQPTNVTAVAANLTLVKSDAGGDPLPEGGVLTYTLTVSNAGPDAANNVTVVDVLDSNQFYLADTAPGGCSEAPAGTLTCAVGSIANGGSTAFEIVVFVPTGGPTGGTLQSGPCDGSEDLCNTASVTASTPDPVPAGNDDDEPTDVAAAMADLQITKDDAGSDPVGLGGTVVYTVTVTNPGPDDAQDVVVTDLLDANTTYVADDFGCVEAPAGTLTCDLGALLAGQSQDIEIMAAVSPSAPTAGSLQNGPCDGSEDICNVIGVASSTGDPDPSNNSADEPTDVVDATADVAIAKSDAGSDPAAPSGTLTYTLTATNGGPDAADNVVVTDILDAGTTYVGDTGGCSEALGVLTCNLGTLANGASVSFDVTATVSAAAPSSGTLSSGDCDGSEDLCNQATVSTSAFDPVPANNSDDEPTDVTPTADLEVFKSAPASVVPGSPAVFTVSVTNHGPGDAAMVVVSDPTPAGLAFSSNAGDCTSSYPCALGSVAAGESRTIVTTYSVPSSYTALDPVVNTATVSSASPDPVPANNTKSASAPVVPDADLALVKTGPGAVTPGTDLVYTIIVTNNGGSDAAGVTVTDPTPPGLAFVSNTGDCTTPYPCSLGAVAAGSSRSITTTYSVPVLYTTPDPIVNTATVSSTTADDTPGNNSDSASTTLSVVQADLEVLKSGPASTAPGDDVVFTVLVTNHGPAPATSVTVTDPTPGTLSFVSNTGDCATAYPCSLGILAPGATRTITSTYAVPASYTTPDPIENTAVVSSAEADPVAPNSTSTASVAVLPSADLAVVKTAPSLVVPGADAVFTVTVTNNGPSDANGVSVADPTPSGLGFGSNSGDCTTAYPCSLGTLAAGATRTITTTYSVPPSYSVPDPVVNTATVSATTSDPDPADNSDTASAPVAAVDLTITKSHSGSFETCQNAAFTLQVRNNGDVATTGTVTVTDVLPSALGYVSASGSGWTCSASGQTVSCTRTAAIAPGAPAPAIALVVAVGESAFPTVTNTASVSVANDDNPVNDSASDGVTVRAGSCTPGPADPCSVALRKVHSGNDNPGGEIQYTLQWSNSCREDLEDVVVSDPLPAGLLLLTATSPDATATTSGNTATFRMTRFGGGDVALGYITARIDDDAATGSAIVNVATYSDGDGNGARATNSFRVRGGSTGGETISCALRAQVYARPGRYVKYEARYKNGSLDNSLTLVLPDDVEIVSIYPDPTAVDGNSLYWDRLARTSGKVTINTLVSPGAEDEAILPSAAIVDDHAGNTGVCEHVSVVDRNARLFTSVKAQTLSRPGAPLRYTARYRNAFGSNRLTVSLPNEVTILRATPAPTGGSATTLVWEDLPVPSGSVKVDTVVGSVANGTVLVGSVTMSDDSSDIVGAEHRTTIGPGTTSDGGGGPVSLTASALRSVTAGTSSDISVRYDGLQPPATVTVQLPAEMTPVLTVPAATVSESTVTWNGLPAGGSVKVRVAVSATATPGKTLTVRVVASDPSGASATATASSVVRE